MTSGVHTDKFLGLIDSSYHRENAGTPVSGNNSAISANGGDASDEDSKPKKASGFSSFAALGTEDVPQDDEEDFGGLMVRHTYMSTTIYASHSISYDV